jgi:hypothetical protein
MLKLLLVMLLKSLLLLLLLLYCYRVTQCLQQLLMALCTVLCVARVGRGDAIAELPSLLTVAAGAALAVQGVAVHAQAVLAAAVTIRLC